MLLSAALARPDCVGIGIDINEDAIAAGQRQAQRLGIVSIELVAAGLNDVLSVSPGEFDYILIRGDFIPAGMPERDALLQWCRRHLSAYGIIAIHQILPRLNPRHNTFRMRWPSTHALRAGQMRRLLLLVVCSAIWH